VLILAPGEAGSGYSDAGIALAARRDADVRAAASNGQADAGPREIEMDAWEKSDAALEAEAHFTTMMARSGFESARFCVAALRAESRCPENQRLAKHLRHEQPHLFTFLRCPGLPATNNSGERAIRPMAMARKTWGGNRTANGARTQQILASVLRTCWQQGKNAFDQLVKLLAPLVRSCWK
jgi:hypothetical protein